MNRLKWLGLALGLILVLVGGWLFFNKQPKLSGHHTVELTTYGFFPAELTIHQGETVTFTTQRDEPFWPASDPHPIHTNFPAFDPKKALKPGERWGFTFNEPGIFSYHDHLGSYYSADTGIIRVLKPGETADNLTPPPPVSETLTDCSEVSNKRKCWLENLKSIMVYQGLPATFEAIADLYATEIDFPATCNDITHYVGGFGYRVFAKNKNKVVIPESAACAAGFYHGFLETWFHNNPELDEALDFCDYVTQKLGSTNPHVIHDCFHGIGHGAYHLYHVGDWDNFAASMEPIFEVCEKTKDVSSCINGVFNAANMDYHETRYKYLEEKENPFKYCDLLNRYQDICYRGFVVSLIWSGEGDLASALKVINTIQNPEYAKGALVSAIQVSAFANTGSDNHLEILALCRSLNPDLATECLQAYVRGLMEQGTPGRERQTGVDFCRLKLLNPQEGEICLNYVNEYSKNYYPTQGE